MILWMCAMLPRDLPWHPRNGHTGESYILSGERLSVVGMIKTVQEVIGKQLLTLKMPMQLAHFSARFTPLYYRLTRTKPRFTPYSLETITSNSVISMPKPDESWATPPDRLPKPWRTRSAGFSSSAPIRQWYSIMKPMIKPSPWTEKIGAHHWCFQWYWRGNCS